MKCTEAWVGSVQLECTFHWEHGISKIHTGIFVEWKASLAFNPSFLHKISYFGEFTLSTISVY